MNKLCLIRMFLGRFLFILLLCGSSVFARVVRQTSLEAIFIRTGEIHVSKKAPGSLGIPILPSTASIDVPVQLELPTFNNFLFPGIDVAPDSEYSSRVAGLSETQLGPLVIEAGSLLLYQQDPNNVANTGCLTWDGYVNFFGKQAAVSLDSITFTRSGGTGPADPFIVTVTDFVISLALPAGDSTIQVIPGQDTSVSSISIHFQSGQDPELSFQADVFGATRTFIGSLVVGEQEDFLLEAPLLNKRIGDLLPYIDETLVSDFIINGFVRFSTEQGFDVLGDVQAVGGGAAEVEFFSGKPIVFTTFRLLFSDDGPSVKMDATFQGASVECYGYVDMVNEDTVMFLSLEDLYLSSLYPELANSDFDSVVFDVSIRISKKDGTVLSGSTSSGEKEFFGVNVRRLELTIDLVEGQGFISGRFYVLGLPLAAMFTLNLGSSGGPTMAFSIELASLRDVRWRPFNRIAEDIPALGELKKIEVTGIRAAIDAEYTARLNGSGGYDSHKVSLPKIYAKVLLKKTGTVIIKNVIDGAKKKLTGKAKKPKNLFGLVTGLLSPQDPEKFATGLIKESISKFINSKLQYNPVVDPSGGTKFEIYIGGNASVLGATVELVAKAGISQDVMGITLGASLADGWKLSDSFPQLFTPASLVTEALDQLKISESRFIISTKPDVIGTFQVQPGFNFMTGLALDPTATESDNIVVKSLSVMAENSGSDPAALTMTGSFNPLSIRNLVFKIGLSVGGFQIPIPPLTFNAASINLVMRGEPTIGLEGSFTVVPFEGEDPLIFGGEIMFSLVDCGLAFSMLNVWNNPFGIPAFSFGNLGIKATQRYSVIVDTLSTGGISAFIPSTLAMTGYASFGTVDPIKGLITAALGTNISNLALNVDIDNPPELVNCALSLAQEYEAFDPDAIALIASFIPLRVRKFRVMIVPLPMVIGNILIDQGVGGQFEVDVFGRRLGCDFSFDPKGLFARGVFPKINIGPLWITSADGTAGANAMIGMHLEKGIGFKLDGRVSFIGVFEQAADIEISKDGLTFEVETTVGPPELNIESSIKATSISFKDPLAIAKVLRPEDLKLEYEFKNSLATLINDFALDALDSLKDSVQKIYNDIIEQIARNTALSEIVTQQEAVDIAYARRIPFWENPVLSVQRELEYQAAVVQLLFLQTKYYLERTPFGRFAIQKLDELGLTPIINGALQVFEDFGTLLFEHGAVLVKSFVNFAVVERAYWSGSLKDLGDGVIPGLEVDIKVAGEPYTKKFSSFNMVDPVKSVETIAKDLATFGYDVIKKNLNAVRSQSERKLLAAMERSSRYNSSVTRLKAHGIDVALERAIYKQSCDVFGTRAPRIKTIEQKEICEHDEFDIRDIDVLETMIDKSNDQNIGGIGNIVSGKLYDSVVTVLKKHKLGTFALHVLGEDDFVASVKKYVQEFVSMGLESNEQEQQEYDEFCLDYLDFEAIDVAQILEEAQDFGIFNSQLEVYCRRAAVKELLKEGVSFVLSKIG